MDKKSFDLYDGLISRLDNLESCEDNPVYKREIQLIRAELEEIQLDDNHT